MLSLWMRKILSAIRAYITYLCYKLKHYCSWEFKITSNSKNRTILVKLLNLISDLTIIVQFLQLKDIASAILK